MSGTDTQRVVSADRPWLGLMPFTPQTKEYFYGRDREIRDLFLRVREQPLTILFGQSGLGKTSLLGAGLIPKLEVEGFCPCWVRLRYESSDLPLLEQTRLAIRRTLGANLDSALDQNNLTLWEMFHDLSHRSEGFAENPPVFIFDQFEEIFTLTDTPRKKREAEEFFFQLADLIENRPPHHLQEQFRTNRRLAMQYDLSPTPERIVITLREDFLSQLETWKKVMPSLMRNRIGLRQLDGPQALEAVVRPGRREQRELVSDEVGASIVRFVAKKSADVPLEEIGAVPPLLSLLCDELNEARLAAGAEQITAEQVRRQSADILQNFYLRSFDGLPAAVRNFIEDRLVTVGGHRNPAAREDAIAELQQQGVENPAAAIDRLIQGRLLSSEERGGVQRLEITHDVLTPLVVVSRDERRIRERAERAEREREETLRQRRRLQRVAAAMLALTLLAVAGAAVSIYAFRQANAQRVVADTAKQAAEDAKEVAENQRLLAVRQKSEAERQKSEAERQKSAAEKQRAEAERQKQVADDQRLRAEREWERAEQALKSESTARAAAENAEASASRAREQAEFNLNVRNVMLAETEWQAADVGRAKRLLQQYPPEQRQWEWHYVWRLCNSAKHRFDLGSRVSLVRFAPDDSHLLTASGVNDREALLSIWDWDNGQRLRDLVGLNSVVLDAMFIDADHVAAITAREFVVWNRQTGAVSRRQEMPEAKHGAFSSDGRFACVLTERYDRLSQTQKNSVSVFRVEPWEPIQSWSFDNEGVSSMALSGDGAQLAVAFRYNWISIRDCSTGSEIGRIDGTESPSVSETIFCLAFSPNGKQLATGGLDARLRLWNLEEMVDIRLENVFTDHSSAIVSVVYDRGGSQIATASWDNTARVWTTGKSNRSQVIRGHEDWLHDVAFSPSGNSLATGSRDRTAQVWHLTESLQLNNEGHWIDSIAIHPRGREIAVARGFGGLRVWKTTMRIPDMHNDECDKFVLYNSTGDRLLTRNREQANQLLMIDTGNTFSRRNITPLIGHEDEVFTAVSLPRSKAWGQGRFITADRSGMLIFWDAATGRELERWNIPERLVALATNRDGDRLLVGRPDQRVVLYDISTRQAQKTFQAPSDILSVALSPDGNWLATGGGVFGKVGDLTIWDSSDAQPRHQIQGHRDWISALVFHPDNRRLFSGSYDRALRVWDVELGLEMMNLRGHGREITTLTLSEDGCILYSADRLGMVSSWDARPINDE